MRAIVASLLLLPTLAMARDDGAGTYTGCVFQGQPGYRFVRLIYTPYEACYPWETTITWNQRGRPGASPVAVSVQPGDASCPYGGTRIVAEGVTTYACNGAPGLAGAAGLQGAMGPSGLDGLPGSQGPQGPRGEPGPVGPQGPRGEPGATGPQGPLGLEGPMGPAGLDGLPGPQGPKGDTGPKGEAGAQGPKGELGDVGPIGPTGPVGPQGAPGQGVTLVQLAPGDVHCPAGGVAVTAPSGTAYVCAPGTPPLVDAAGFQLIDQWAGLPTDTVWTLCYKASRDNVGFSFPGTALYAFHSRCDGRGSSFFVTKAATGHLFGGYRSVPWNSAATCAYQADPDAFLFSLTNDFKHALDIATPSHAAAAVYDCASRGIIFGGGYDFTTNLQNSASVNLGFSYFCRSGSGAACAADLAGSASPTLIELEVYVAR